MRGEKKQTRWLVIQAAALGWDLLQRRAGRVSAAGLQCRRAEAVFPALTCTAQATLRTAADPEHHGLWANGFYDRAWAKTSLWEQSAALVSGPRIWDSARASGQKVGMMFFQQSLGESADLLLSPKPIHRHHGGMVMDCLDRPSGLYARLCAELGSGFPLHRYWGPMAGGASTRWICEAVRKVVSTPDLAPDVLFVYLPHLDYALQRHGPESPQALQALDELWAELSKLWTTAESQGYTVVCMGDYAIAPVTRSPVYPSLHLREKGLFETHAVRGRLYPDFFHSRAVAVCDHEVALIYGRDAGSLRVARRALESLAGVAELHEIRDGNPRGPRTPDLIAVAEEGGWFAYPWWTRRREAPDYASHIDIHNKPGYDPCELFWGWPPPGISMDPGRIRGTHGRAGPGRPIAWISRGGLGKTSMDHYEGLARALSAEINAGRDLPGDKGGIS